MSDIAELRKATTESPAVLALAGIGFGYGRDQVLSDVSLQVSRGEFVTVLGPSGCGKSSLLKLIAGVVEPSEGQLSLRHTTAGKRLGNISLMQQRDLLLDWRTVAENAGLGLELSGIDSSEIPVHVKRIAEAFGLEDVLQRYPWELSGGMRQRVALMRTLLIDSELVLLDEPLGALDAITRSKLQLWLLDVVDQQDKTFLMVSHDIDEALLMSDRIVVMAPNPGRVIEEVVVPVIPKKSHQALLEPEVLNLKRRILSLLANQEQVA